MTQLTDRTRRRLARPEPDEVELDEPRTRSVGIVPRVLGAVAVLVVGVVHLEQYVAVHIGVVPVIGPLFALNFAGAVVIALGLVLPLRRVHVLLALAGIGLAATSFAALLVSEHRPLFGFQDDGYRPAIVVSLVAEALAVLFLSVYLAARFRRDDA